MAVLYLRNNSAYTDTSTLSINIPTYSEGDLLLCIISHDYAKSSTTAVPSDWTTILEEAGGSLYYGDIRAYYKIAGSDEPASVSWSFNNAPNNDYIKGVIMVFSGVDTTSPVDAYASASDNTIDSTATAPSVTTNVDGCLIVRGYAIRNAGGTYSFNNTEIIDMGTGRQLLGIEYETQESSGATGTEIATNTKAYRDATLTIAIAPSSSIEANSERGLYIQGKGSDNSVRGLYLEGASELVEGWYNSNWKYRVKITVDKDKVGSTLTDFPVYVDLSTLPSGFHTNVKNDGGDIRVTRSDGTTECPREVVFYDSTNDKGELHFKANSLSSTTDTVFYIYYGNSSATEPISNSTYGRENVWSDYGAVYHLNENPSGTEPQILDSTGNSNDGTSHGSMTSEDSVSAVIGKGLDLDGSNDYISISRDSSLEPSYITVSFWIKSFAYGCPVAKRELTSPSSKGYLFHGGGSYGLAFRVYNSTGSSKEVIGSTLANDTWYHVVGVYDGSNVKIYLNTSASYSVAMTGNILHSDDDLLIGSQHYNGAISGFNKCLLDEVRISGSARNSDWISTEYNNQSSPSTFYSAGSEETGSERSIYTKGKISTFSERGLYIDANINDERNLYTKGKNIGNSERILYSFGSQMLSTDYFNVEFNDLSVEASSERGLYIRGSDVGTSGRNLLLEGKPVVSERSLYLSGYIHTSSTRDLFLEGFDTDISERGLYTQGTRSGASERSLYTQGSLEVSGERILYLIGKSLEGERELYIWGSEIDNSERGLFVEGAYFGYGGRELYIQGYLSDISARELYLSGYDTETSERVLHLSGIDLGASERGLYVWGKETDTSGRSLYIHGCLEDSSERGLYLTTYALGGLERGLYTWGWEESSSARGIYLFGKDEGEEERGLYIHGFIRETGERVLYLYGIGKANPERSLYIQGRLQDTSERNIYTTGYVKVLEDRGIYIRGTWRPWVDKSVEYDTIYKDKGVVSGSSFNKTIINKTDTFNKRGTSEGGVWIDEKASGINNFTRKL